MPEGNTPAKLMKLLLKGIRENAEPDTLLESLCEVLPDLPGIATAAYHPKPTEPDSQYTFRLPVSTPMVDFGEFHLEINDPNRFKQGRDYLQGVGALLGVLLAQQHQSSRPITASLRTQEEEDYFQLLELAPDAFVRGDTTGRLLYVNRTAVALTGYPRAELMAMNISQLFPEEELEEKPLRYDLLHEGKMVRHERFIRTRKGDLVPVEMHSRMMPDQTFQTFMRNISARKQAEQALKDSEKKYRELFEKTDDAILIIENNTFVDCNEATVRMLRYGSKEDLLNTHPSELSPEFQPDGRPSYEKADEMMATAFARGSHRFEWDHKRADGVVFPVEVLLTAVSKEGDKKILHTVWRDITDRKAAEQRLRESEQKFRTLVNQATDAMMVSNLDGRIIDVNERACEYLGYTREELLNLSVQDYDEELENIDQLRELKNSLSDSSTITFESRHRRKDGSIFPVEVSCGIITVNSEPVILAFVRDITERKETEARLFQAQKMDSIGNLAGGVAHDFNNMLGGIMGYASMLQMKETNPRKQTALESIIRAAERAGELTNKLLAFGRKGKHLVQAVNMNHVVDEVYGLLSRSMDKSISFETDLAEDLFTVDADPAQMNQVMMNLCVNASQAMPGGGTLTVRTSNERITGQAGDARILKPGSYVRVVVSDTGHGMDDETRRRAFEPFFTTKANGDIKGTGLGLATVYGIVTNHGGLVEIESEKGAGTTVTVHLPKGIRKAPSDESAAKDTHTGQGHILVVDDEDVVRQMVKDMLESLGYAVLTARDGLEGVNTFKHHHNEIDGVILDMKMPRMAGPEAFQKMREIDPDVRILLSTGYGLNEEAQRLMDKGAVGLVAKPYQLHDLSEAVRKMLE